VHWVGHRAGRLELSVGLLVLGTCLQSFRLTPSLVATDWGNHQAAQHGELRERVDIGAVRVPTARPGVLGVDFEDRFGAGERRQGRVRNERAQAPRPDWVIRVVAV
jgi:hypothetical protein